MGLLNSLPLIQLCPPPSLSGNGEQVWGLIRTEKINQRRYAWGGGETWREKVNAETEQLASLPRISPSGVFGFRFLTQFRYVGLGLVVVIVVLFFLFLRG